MQLLFLQQLIPDTILKAIGWTLIHSLWQGLLAAAVAGCIILSTRRSTAIIRYNLLGAVLIGFLVTTAITFYTQWTLVSQQTILSINTTTESINDIRTLLLFQTNIPSESFNFSGFVTWFNSNADILVGAWAFLCLLHCLLLMTGLAGVTRMRNTATSLPPLDNLQIQWSDRVQQLARRLHIRECVNLLQSDRVKVPVAIGIFKPVILVPLGLLSQLPADQVETILLHELAHIRRRDYLINILQRFIEALFFFNPAIRWISNQLRQEREACCDDIVVANTIHKGTYLEALISFQEYVLDESGLAMAIGTKRNYLLSRVRRMLTRENKKLNLMEKTTLLSGLIAVMAFSFIPTKGETKKQEPIRQTTELRPISSSLQPPAPITASFRTKPTKLRPLNRQLEKPIPLDPITTIEAVIDTVPKEPTKESSKVRNGVEFRSLSRNTDDDGKNRTETINATDKDGKKYTINRLNGKITSLTVDGATIPESEHEKYNEVLQKIEAAGSRRQEEILQRQKTQLLRSFQNRDSKKLFDRNRTEFARKMRNAEVDRQRLLVNKKVYSELLKRYNRERTEKSRLLFQRKSRPTLNGREIILNKMESLKESEKLTVPIQSEKEKPRKRVTI